MKRHDIDVVSLVAGLVLLSLALLWPLWRLDAIGLDDFGWFAAVALVSIGVLGVAVSLLKATKNDHDREGGTP